MQECKVETSALPAQYGYHSTATVNAVTKPGSNEFHGDVFEFLRNTELTARDFFNSTRTQLNRNQFGAEGPFARPRFQRQLYVVALHRRHLRPATPARRRRHSAIQPARLPGNCTGIDQRQQFVLNLVATSSGLRNPWARRLLSDWQIAPILQIHSGQWLTVTSGTDRALTTVANQTVNQVLSNPYAANKGVANGNATINWLNLEAFAIPALGTYGTTADGIVVGPGLIQLNMALSRTFKIRERTSFQLRGEAFNLPKHLNPGRWVYP